MQSRPTDNGPSRRLLLRLSLRAIAICSVLGLALFLGGRLVVFAALPALTVFIDTVQSDFVADLSLAPARGGWMVQMRPLSVRAIPIAPGKVLQAGTRLEPFATTLAHTLVPPLLFLTAVLVWPATRPREWLVRLLAAVPTLAVLLLLGAPILLMGRLQMWLVEMGMHYGAAFREPAWVTFMIFMESGGNWLLPLCAAIACVGIGRRVCRPPADPTMVDEHRQHESVATPTTPAQPLAFPPV